MLASIATGMVGLQFGLFVNALALLGIDATPAGEGQPDPGKSVGMVGSLIAALSLIFMSFTLVVGAPFGTEGLAAQVQIMFSAISGMYGFLFLGFGFIQLQGWDLRPVGNAALGAAIMQVIEGDQYKTGARRPVAEDCRLVTSQDTTDRTFASNRHSRLACGPEAANELLAGSSASAVF